MNNYGLNKENEIQVHDFVIWKLCYSEILLFVLLFFKRVYMDQMYQYSKHNKLRFYTGIIVSFSFWYRSCHVN